MPATEAQTLAHDQELAGLDLLELAVDAGESRGRRLWRSTWPKVAALVFGIGFWQVVVWSGWRPEFALAPPREAWNDLWEYLEEGTLTTALGITMRRAAVGFALAIVIGTIVGSLVARIRPLRAAVGSLITGLQTMPSIAWFPLAILIFQLSEQAILFVVVLGAAPSIANGLIAGELLVVLRGKESVGFLLNQNREVNNSSGLLATMIVILVIGIVVDSVLFGTLERAIRRRWGLLDAAR